MSEDQVNDDHSNTESNNDDLNVHAETLYAPDREVLENVARDSEEELRDDDKVTAEEIDNHPNEFDLDILDNRD